MCGKCEIYFIVGGADLLREGDELLEVNGVPVSGKSTDEIVTLMVSKLNYRSKIITVEGKHCHRVVLMIPNINTGVWMQSLSVVV